MSRAENRERAARGRKVLGLAGDLLRDPKAERLTLAADVLADVLHALRPEDRPRALRLGLGHFLAESPEVEGTAFLELALAALGNAP